jgi:hypothetical protein
MQTKFSWKTSAAGIVAVAAVVITQFFPQYHDLFDKVVGVAVGLGLLAARDNNVTSKQAGVE